MATSLTYILILSTHRVFDEDGQKWQFTQDPFVRNNILRFFFVRKSLVAERRWCILYTNVEGNIYHCAT